MIPPKSDQHPVGGGFPWGFLFGVGSFVLAQVFIRATLADLPEKVASHFNVSGQADGWLPRDQYGLFLGGLLLFITVVVQLSNQAARFLPVRFINIPYRDFWLSPERQVTTIGFMISRGWWLTGIIALFFGALHHLVLLAHAANPPHLPVKGLLAMGGFFLALVIIWSVSFLWHFFQVPADVRNTMPMFSGLRPRKP